MKEILLRIYNKLTDVRKRVKFCSTKEFCNVSGYNYFVIKKESICNEFRPSIWKIKEEEETIIRTFPETYVAEIKNATIIGENELIMCQNKVLCDTYTCEFVEYMKLEKGVVKRADLVAKEVELHYHSIRHLPIDKGICLIGNFPYSYYHFVINILPKLYYISNHSQYENYPWIIDARAYKNFKEIIEIFNIHKNKVICINQNVAYRVKKLVVASNCVWYDRYIQEQFYKDVGHRYDSEAIRYVREVCLESIKEDKIIEKVYVSRTKLPEDRKRLENEEEVEQLFHKYGFISVYPEELSFIEQVKLFRNVKVFAGVAGAAFTNMIFLPQDAVVIYSTFMDGNRGENLYPSLWNSVCEGKFFMIHGKETIESKKKKVKDNLRKFTLRIEEIEELLNSIYL